MKYETYTGQMITAEQLLMPTGTKIELGPLFPSIKDAPVVMQLVGHQKDPEHDGMTVVTVDLYWHGIHLSTEEATLDESGNYYWGVS